LNDKRIFHLQLVYRFEDRILISKKDRFVTIVKNVIKNCRKINNLLNNKVFILKMLLKIQEGD